MDWFEFGTGAVCISTGVVLMCGLYRLLPRGVSIFSWWPVVWAF